MNRLFPEINMSETRRFQCATNCNSDPLFCCFFLRIETELLKIHKFEWPLYSGLEFPPTFFVP